MKKVIGIIMLSLPFIALFTFVAIKEGVLWLLIFLAAIAFIIGWIYIGVNMIDK